MMVGRQSNFPLENLRKAHTSIWKEPIVVVYSYTYTLCICEDHTFPQSCFLSTSVPRIFSKYLPIWGNFPFFSSSLIAVAEPTYIPAVWSTLCGTLVFVYYTTYLLC